MNQEIIEVPVSEVVFRKDLYPRFEGKAETVQKYAEDLDVLPPIEINQRKELIDGWNRWTAHKKREAQTIRAVITETESDAQFLELTIERNSKHGAQLSQADKQAMARRIYGATADRDRDAKKAHLAKILSVSERTVRDWLSRIDKENREKRNDKIFDMWLACHSQEEIAEVVDCDRTLVAKQAKEYVNSVLQNQNHKAACEHATDFNQLFYDIWKQQEKTTGAGHFGNSEVRWVDNLLKKYTKPFDIVVDPFAGGGSTRDICRKRFRRYWVSDRKVLPEHEGNIRQHDLTAGLPLGDQDPRWKDVRLVYLDPPYWKQAEGQYSQDPSDLANMSLEDFNKSLFGVISAFAKKLESGARIALIIQPTQWKAPDRRIVDHADDMRFMVRSSKLPLAFERKISAPYESQQCNAQMVDWAKANDEWLVLTREIVVWRVE